MIHTRNLNLKTALKSHSIPKKNTLNTNRRVNVKTRREAALFNGPNNRRLLNWLVEYAKTQHSVLLASGSFDCSRKPLRVKGETR
jgi:hypothetical protein